LIPAHGVKIRRAIQMANGKWQTSNGLPFGVCHLNFEFIFRLDAGGPLARPIRCG
jgi:hypothetical protein